jgi:cell division protein FtsN
VREGTAPVEIEIIKAERPSGGILSTAQAEPSGARAVEPSNNINYFIQAASFSERANAERLKERLLREDLGAAVEIQAAELPRGPVYRVRLGPLRAVEQVDRLAARLVAFEITSPQVLIE